LDRAQIVKLRALFSSLLALAATSGFAAELTPKAIPRMAALPLPHHQISFERDGIELTRFHCDPNEKRSFLYPLNGPSGLSLTRMGHPHDPFTHSHHNSLWLSHHNVGGTSFWEDRGPAQIRCLRVERLEDADDFAAATVLHAWTGTNGVPLLFERRRMAVHTMPNNEWLLVIDIRFDAAKQPAVFGKTPFGLFGVRMRKSIGVHDGAGTIRNSEGGRNEAGVHWKRARWADYSGAVKANVIEGITAFDHPNNPNHPTYFHVRDDGWMGASLTYEEPLTVEPGKGIQLRYGFYVHSGLPAAAVLNERWEQFSKMAVTNLPAAKQ
jgi:hypothetical protein